MTYEEFIEKMRTLNQGEYKQRHHIIPLSEGGTDDMTNTIYLSWTNHYIAHLLLAKDGKAVRAFKHMGDLDTWYHKCYADAYGSLMTEERKKQISESKKGQLKGSKWYNNGIRNVRAYECPEGFVEGRIITEKHREALKSDETRQKMSKARTEYWKNKRK